MSQARVKTVQRAQKDQGTCGKCGDALPVGSPYRWFKVGFRSRFKRVRCMKPGCTPLPSEKESSNLAEAYAAQEAAYHALDAAGTLGDIQAVLEECASAAGDVVSQYEASVEAAPMLEDQLRSTIDALEAWQEELEGVQVPDDEDAHCDEHDEPVEEGCDACGEVHDEMMDTTQQEVREAIDSLEA
jgi:hypothetical protein